MPKIIIGEEQLAVVRVLESLGWSHSRIGRVFSVEHSTITYALRRRKTKLPGQIEELHADLLAKTLDRVDRAMRKAVAHELLIICRELAKP
jgi:hypothetical protein